MKTILILTILTLTSCTTVRNWHTFDGDFVNGKFKEKGVRK